MDSLKFLILCLLEGPVITISSRLNNLLVLVSEAILFLSNTEICHSIRKISPRLHSLGWLDWCPPDQSNTIRLGASVLHVSILRRSILWHFSDCNIRTLQRNSFPTQFRTWINYQQEKIFLCNRTSHELYNNNVFSPKLWFRSVSLGGMMYGRGEWV